MAQISTIPFPSLSRYTVLHNTDNTISASMPVDSITMPRLCSMLENTKYIKEIIFTPPLDARNIKRLEGEIGETLVWLFGCRLDLKRLERVVLPMEFRTTIKSIFHRLGRLPRLKSLTITIPQSFDYMASGPISDHQALDNSIQTGIEALTLLQEVTVPAIMLTNGLRTILDCLFDASVASYDGNTIRYYLIAKDSE